MKTLHAILSVLAITGTVSADAPQTSADDIFKGVRGPTNVQLDERVSASRNDQHVETFTNTLIGKYWNGEARGMWGFASIPYKTINGPNGKASGLGDLTIGVGPRGTAGNFHWLSYAGLALPTGKTEGKIPIGNGRTDIRIGILQTLRSEDKRLELDGLVEYAITGENNHHTNPPNAFAFGFLGGGSISEHVRAIAGMTGTVNSDGSAVLNAKAVARYTFSPTAHVECAGELGLRHDRIPQSRTIGIYARFNI